MRLQGTGNQQRRDYLFDASGKITTGGTPQLVLPVAVSRSFLFLQNTSATDSLAFEIGCARATAAITSGQVSSITITNAGFNFTKPPVVRFLGGGTQLGGGNQLAPAGQFVSSGSAANPSYLGYDQPGGSSPGHPAAGHAVLTTGAVTSIIIDDPGAGYAIAPFVQLFNSDLDPYGAALPDVTAAAQVGIVLGPNAWFKWDATVCPTDAVSVIGLNTTNTNTFTVKWME